MKPIFTILNVVCYSLLVISCNNIANEYILNEKDLVPEGIDYSIKNHAVYLTSVAKSKIIKVDLNSGRQTDFIKENEFGYSPGAGLYIDDSNDILYALGGYYMTNDSLSSLYAFDMNTNNLIKRYSISNEGNHFLNDMTIDDIGNIYITDSKNQSIYYLDKSKDLLELFYTSPEIDFPNGIAISDDNTKLYIASIPKGVRVMDLNSRKILNAADTSGISQGIDGLEFKENNLYGIQNSVGANSFNFRKLILNDELTEIIDVEIIDSHTPKLDVPLTFCFAQDKAIVIGNSNLQFLNQVSFEFQESDTIKNTKLIVYSIN